MNIPNLPFLEKKGKSEYFLSLILRDEKASAVVFEEVTGKVNIVGQQEEKFKTSLEDATEEELLSTIDSAVSGAESSLPPDVESQKTIFGVKDSWVEGGKINADYLAKLKKVSEELEFKPVGFLVIPEAIAHLLQKEEGAPVSGIIAEIGERLITVSVIKAGKIVESKSSAIHDSAPFTVDTLLKHITNSEVLPSRIILFDSGDEKLQQEFAAHQWSKSLPFLHIPQITNLPAGFDSRAVLEGAAHQMGFEVLDKSTAAAPLMPSDSEITGDKTLGEVIKNNDFGFVEGSDIADKKDEEQPKTANPDVEEKIGGIPEEMKVGSSKRQFPIQAAMIFAGLKGVGAKISPLLANTPLRGFAAGRKMLLLPLIPLLLLILIFYIYFFQRSAVVTLSFNEKAVEETENVTFAESQNSDISINLIKASFVTTEQDGKDTIKTTGKKETGDKAKGVVTMFNNSTSAVTIPQGTEITSSNDLIFITDKDVKISSASGDIFSGTKPGTANVNVTAEEFGTNYNLPSNTKFTVSGNSNVAAKNDDAFSGGTKKEIKVVSKQDQDRLQKRLQEKLESEAMEQLSKKIESDEELLPTFISVTYESKNFNKDVDDEASELTLTGKITFEAVSYKKSDILDFAKEKLKSQSGDKLTISSDNLELEVEDVEQDLNDEVTAELTIKAKLIPNIDEEKTVNDIKGNSIKDAKIKLESISEVRAADIKISWQIPLLPKRLPFGSSKIKIVLDNG